MFDESFYVAVSFAVIIGIFIYLRLPQKLMAALDDKSSAIEKELNEAKRLREEAQALLEGYKAQGERAQAQAEELISTARATAATQAAEAKATMERQIERRTKQAEDRIARSQNELEQEIRASITALAVDAGRVLIAKGLSEEDAQNIIEKNIADIGDRL